MKSAILESALRGSGKFSRETVRALVIATTLTACSTSSESVVDVVESKSEPVAVKAATIAGYQHGRMQSRFAIGDGVTERDEFGMHKYVGSQGVLAVRASGMVTAITNANADSRTRPIMESAAEHDSAVRAYFEAAGIPKDQVASVQDFEVVGAPADYDGLKGTVQYRYSMVKRQINGISVPDSFAWARMNRNGEVVEEQVYWPPIPQAAVDEALALARSVLGNASRETAFRAALPPHKEAKGLAIRHSPGEWDGPFEAAGVYDIVEDKSFPAVVHVNASGHLLSFAHEKPDAWGPVSGTRKDP